MFDLGSSGLEVDDSRPDDRIRLTAYFPETSDRAGVDSRVRQLIGTIGDGEVVSDASDVPDEDWGSKWREHFKPVAPTERMIVHPPWCDVAAPDGGFCLAIEPKTAFGTGSHPTTKMALLALERVTRPGDRIIDVGTGSGILSIAAVRLGATEVLAIDTDPLATENVTENVALNEVSGIRVETRGISSTDVGYQVAVGNIISSVLTLLLPLLASSVVRGGHVILGGLLAREESQFSVSVGNAGLDIIEVTREAEWIGMITKTKR